MLSITATQSCPERSDSPLRKLQGLQSLDRDFDMKTEDSLTPEINTPREKIPSDLASKLKIVEKTWELLQARTTYTTHSDSIVIIKKLLKAWMCIDSCDWMLSNKNY